MNTVTRSNTDIDDTETNTDTGTGVGAARGSAGPSGGWGAVRDGIRREGLAWPEDNLTPSTRPGRVVGIVMPALFLVYLTEPLLDRRDPPVPAPGDAT